MPIAVAMGLAMRSAGHNGRALAWISGFGVVALLSLLPLPWQRIGLALNL